jgi:hypothetical protein
MHACLLTEGAAAQTHLLLLLPPCLAGWGQEVLLLLGPGVHALLTLGHWLASEAPCQRLHGTTTAAHQ